MVTQAQLVRLGGPSRPAEEAGVAELLDPVALEARLNDARARRTEALARRAAGQAPADPRPLVPTQPELTPAEPTLADLKRTVPVPADPVPVAARDRSGGARVPTDDPHDLARSSPSASPSAEPPSPIWHSPMSDAASP